MTRKPKEVPAPCGRTFQSASAFAAHKRFCKVCQEAAISVVSATIEPEATEGGTTLGGAEANPQNPPAPATFGIEALLTRLDERQQARFAELEAKQAAGMQALEGKLTGDLKTALSNLGEQTKAIPEYVQGAVQKMLKGPNPTAEAAPVAAQAAAPPAGQGDNQVDLMGLIQAVVKFADSSPTVQRVIDQFIKPKAREIVTGRDIDMIKLGASWGKGKAKSEAVLNTLDGLVRQGALPSLTAPQPQAPAAPAK